MLKRRLGRTNFDASVIGFGGGPPVPPPPERWKEAVRRAIELGVNLVDTSRCYGESESVIGEAIKEAGQKIFISTKSRFATKEEVARSIDESLHKLKVDKLDLFQMHDVDTEEDLERRLSKGGAIEAMREAREAGKVEFFGISGARPKTLIKALNTGEFDVVTTPYNLLDEAADKELFPLARELDVGILSIRPLDAGSLAIPTKEFRLDGRSTSMAETALRFALSNERVTSVIVGMVNTAEVEADTALGYEAHSFSPDEKRQLQEQAKSLAYTFCNGCGNCLLMCPHFVDIVRVFKLQVLAQVHGMKEYSKAAYREVYKEQVKRCTGCQACTEVCALQLDIPGLLKDVDLLLDAEGALCE